VQLARRTRQKITGGDLAASTISSQPTLATAIALFYLAPCVSLADYSLSSAA
jgi:hypothetical protein